MELSILTANMWLLPPPTSADNDIRLERLIVLIKEKGPDVVNLQEVWMEKYIKRLKEALPNYFTVSPRSFLYNKSGLVTLLKYRPLSQKFGKFKETNNFSPLELLASKGYIYTSFKKDGKEFRLINTHVYETLNKTKIAITIQQTKEILSKALRHNPTIIAGDFNSNRQMLPKKYNNLQSEQSSVKTYCATNKYTQVLYNAFSNLNGVHYEKPDYVFMNMKKKVKITSEAITSPLMSDHYPLLATIKIS